MRIRNTCKSAFERQVTEAVLIHQESLQHNILNSKSEYNRCALPRLSTKLGENEFKEWKKESLEEKKKEEELEGKIRVLRKNRNKNRKGELFIPDPPAEKRRKLGKEKFKTVKQLLEDYVYEEREDFNEKESQTVEEKNPVKREENSWRLRRSLKLRKKLMKQKNLI